MSQTMRLNMSQGFAAICCYHGWYNNLPWIMHTIAALKRWTLRLSKYQWQYMTIIQTNMHKRLQFEWCYLLIRLSWHKRCIILDFWSPKYTTKAAEASQRKFSSISIHVFGGWLGDKKGRCLEHASSSRSSPLLEYPWLCLCLINRPLPRGVPPDIANKLQKHHLPTSTNTNHHNLPRSSPSYSQDQPSNYAIQNVIFHKINK